MNEHATYFASTVWRIVHLARHAPLALGLLIVALQGNDGTCLLLLHALGWATARFARAAEDRFVAALLADVLYFVALTLASAHDCDRAVAARAHVLLTNGHDLDVTFLRSDVVDHHRFAFGAGHRDGVAWLEGFSVGLGLNFVEHLPNFWGSRDAIIAGSFGLGLHRTGE